MDTHEAARRRIYERTRDTWDEGTAEAFMAVLPHTAELATKQDIADLATKQDLALLRKDFEAMELRLLRAIDRSSKTTIVTILGVVTGMATTVAVLAGGLR